jgi:hypothetical protein
MTEHDSSPNDSPKPKRPKWTVWAAIGGLGTIAAALSMPSALQDFVGWARDAAAGAGSVELPAAYPGERFKPAKPAEFAWLADEWCYPSLPGFTTTFRLVDGRLQRRNRGEQPSPFVTEWVDVDVYKSSNGMLRIWHHNDWPGSYVHFSPDKTAEWRENERYLHDDGSVSAGDKMLVLSCGRCTVGADGLTYACNG